MNSAVPVMEAELNTAVPLLVAVSPRDPNVCGVLCCFCWTGIEMPRVLATISQSFAKCFIGFIGLLATIYPKLRAISPGPSELGGNLRNPLGSLRTGKAAEGTSQCPG